MTLPLSPASLPPRFARLIEIAPDGCWLWTGRLDRKGYASVQYQRRHTTAHRLVRELLVGPIPKGLTLDHRCHDKSCPAPGPECPHRRCCNPQHVVPMQRGENAARFHREKSTCPRGHSYDHVDLRGWRKCSTCQKAARHRRRVARGLRKTPAELNSLKTHCLRGHELSGSNLIERTFRGHPRRECAACVKIRRRQRTAADGSYLDREGL